MVPAARYYPARDRPCFALPLIQKDRCALFPAGCMLSSYRVCRQLRGSEVAHTGTAMRELRALRYDPPGYTKQGSRRTTFQSALEQCEQFLAAARQAGYATRPVQLFYALSQAGRAMVAASPHIGNQAWRVSGHGLAANTEAASAAEVTITATKTGLFPQAAAALNVEPLVPGERVELRELWPLLPEAAFLPLSPGALLPVLAFSVNPDALVSCA